LRESWLRETAEVRFDGASAMEQQTKGSRMADGRTGQVKPACENCFFHQSHLCALAGSGPCATFRPAHPDGLRPPRQLRFVFRQERALQVAWAFPSPAEQVALHA
jgi:hypothetical protein